jgi:chromatin assembly factor 1 subunit B
VSSLTAWSFSVNEFRSNDGLTLLMTSSDGFCSTLTFPAGELGQQYTGEVPTAKHPVPVTAASSSQNTPMATPTSTIAPPSPFPSSHHRTSSYPIAPSPPPAPLGPNMRPSSPTRSNSTSSIATQSSLAPGMINNNPALVSGAVPSITASSHGFVSSVNTPPQTPRSAASSVSGLKRDASESENERGDGGPEKKKRRIAPTNISSGFDSKPDSAGTPNA